MVDWTWAHGKVLSPLQESDQTWRTSNRDLFDGIPLPSSRSSYRCHDPVSDYISYWVIFLLISRRYSSESPWDLEAWRAHQSGRSVYALLREITYAALDIEIRDTPTCVLFLSVRLAPGSVRVRWVCKPTSTHSAWTLVPLAVIGMHIISLPTTISRWCRISTKPYRALLVGRLRTNSVEYYPLSRWSFLDSWFLHLRLDLSFLFPGELENVGSGAASKSMILQFGDKYVRMKVAIERIVSIYMCSGCGPTWDGLYKL